MPINYYKVLNVSKNATQDEIGEAYHTLSKKYHPDKNLSEEENILLNKAVDPRIALSPLEEEQKKQINDKLITLRAKLDEVNKAYKILSDPKQRSAHDKVLEEELRRLESFYPHYVDLLKQGKFEEVKNLLEKGMINLDKILEVSADPEAGQGYTILHWAAENNRLDIFEELKPYIKAKHIENYNMSFNILPLHYALVKGNVGIVELILSIPGIDVNDIEDSCIGNKGYAGSSLIINAKNSDLLFMLIEKGLDTQNPIAQENLLTLAVKFVKENDVHSLDALLSKKIINDIDAPNYENNSDYDYEYGTILHAVVENQNIEMMKMFIEHQPNANRQYDGATLLHHYIQKATKNTSAQLILMILFFNADLTIRDNSDKTPLDYLKDENLKKYFKDVARLRENINKIHGDAATDFILQHFEENSDKSIVDCVEYLSENLNKLLNKDTSRASSSLNESKVEASNSKQINM